MELPGVSHYVGLRHKKTSPEANPFQGNLWTGSAFQRQDNAITISFYVSNQLPLVECPWHAPREATDGLGILSQVETSADDLKLESSLRVRPGR